MNKVKYKLNREWLNELLKHKTNSNVYFSLSDNDIRILLTYIDVLQSKIDKANECIEEHFIFDDKNGEYYQTHTFDKDNAKELHDILKEDK